MWSTALKRSEALSREADLFHLAWEAAQTEPAIPVPLVGRHWYVYDTVTGSMVCECGNALPANDEKLSAVVHSTSSMEASALGPVFCKTIGKRRIAVCRYSSKPIPLIYCSWIPFPVRVMIRIVPALHIK